MALQSGIDADVLLSAVPSIQLGVPETATDSGDHVLYSTSVHKYWDATHPIIVEQSPNGASGWSVCPAAEYRFDYCGGQLYFTPARVPATNNYIRLTTAGWYFNVVSVGDCNEWSLDLGGDTEDVTSFQAPGGWRSSIATVRKGSAKISSFKPDDTFSKNLNGRLIIVLYADKSAGTRWESYALLVGTSAKASATGLVTQEASFTLDGEISFSVT